MEIKEKQFLAYERVRLSGVTNMFDVKTVVGLSMLSKAEVIDIMKNYAEYAERWL